MWFFGLASSGIHNSLDTDDIELFSEDGTDELLLQGPASAKRPKLMRTIATVPKSLEGLLDLTTRLEMEDKLRKADATEITLLPTTKFPKVTVGGNKTFAASYSMELGKSKFHFENFQKGEHIEIILGEKGMDKLLANALVFLRYIENIERQKQYKITDGVKLSLPEAIILDTTERDGTRYEISVSAFNFTQNDGCCITIKEANIGNRKEFKQWAIGGNGFYYFINAHVPFFSDFYERYSQLITAIRTNEGLPEYSGESVGSWKKRVNFA